MAICVFLEFPCRRDSILVRTVSPAMPNCATIAARKSSPAPLADNASEVAWSSRRHNRHSSHFALLRTVKCHRLMGQDYYLENATRHGNYYYISFGSIDLKNWHAPQVKLQSKHTLDLGLFILFSLTTFFQVHPIDIFSLPWQQICTLRSERPVQSTF